MPAIDYCQHGRAASIGITCTTRSTNLGALDSDLRPDHLGHTRCRQAERHNNDPGDLWAACEIALRLVAAPGAILVDLHMSCLQLHGNWRTVTLCCRVHCASVHAWNASKVDYRFVCVPTWQCTCRLRAFSRIFPDRSWIYATWLAVKAGGS